MRELMSLLQKNNSQSNFNLRDSLLVLISKDTLFFIWSQEYGPNS